MSMNYIEAFLRAYGVSGILDIEEMSRWKIIQDLSDNWIAGGGDISELCGMIEDKILSENPKVEGRFYFNFLDTHWDTNNEKEKNFIEKKYL